MRVVSSNAKTERSIENSSGSGMKQSELAPRVQVSEARLKALIHSRNAWRHPQDVVALKHFDFPAAHKRGLFNPKFVAAVSTQRTAGCRTSMTPEEIRDAIRQDPERVSQKHRVYIRWFMSELSLVELKWFRFEGGVSLYELARLFITLEIRQPILVEWLNCASNLHQRSIVSASHAWWPDTSKGSKDFPP